MRHSNSRSSQQMLARCRRRMAGHGSGRSRRTRRHFPGCSRRPCPHPTPARRVHHLTCRCGGRESHCSHCLEAAEYSECMKTREQVKLTALPSKSISESKSPLVGCNDGRTSDSACAGTAGVVMDVLEAEVELGTELCAGPVAAPCPCAACPRPRPRARVPLPRACTEPVEATGAEGVVF